MDLIAVGEGEELVGELLAAHRAAFAPGGEGGRERFLLARAPSPGLYVPAPMRSASGRRAIARVAPLESVCPPW